MTAERGRV